MLGCHPGNHGDALAVDTPSKNTWGFRVREDLSKWEEMYPNIPITPAGIVPGLGAYSIAKPVIPAEHRFLFRGEWVPGNRGPLVELLATDRRLLAALCWLQWGPEREVTDQLGLGLAESLVEEMGVDLAREAAVGIVLFRAYRIGCSEEFNYDNFWTRAFARGVAAHHVDKLLDGGHPVRAFLASFFANFGEVVLVACDPQRYDRLLLDDTGVDFQAHEREYYGIDRHTVSWIVLRDAGLSRVVIGPSLEASRRVRSWGDPTDYPILEKLKFGISCTKSYALAQLIGQMIVSEAAERTAMWEEFVVLRNDLKLDRDDLNEVCDSIVNDWWDWGELMSTPIRTLPGFAALSEWNERGVKPVRFNSTGGKPLIPHQIAEAGDGLDILFVEDTRPVRESVRRLLERAGHRVQVAGDGFEALEVLRQNPPQVVLADWRMPNMDGLELCRHLRRTELGKRVFFILFTGEEDGDAIVDAYQSGINDFITKRGSTDVLLARISAARNFIAQWEAVDTDRRIIRAHCEHSRHVAAQMKSDSVTDTLTGLPNRRFAMDRLREEWSRTQRAEQDMSVVMLDIDHFKKVNDAHGHDVGDLVLRETARVIQSVTRRNEAACRIGGEEFLIICSEADLEAAASCAERVRRAVEMNLINFGSFSGNITMSLGVSQRTGEVESTDALFKGADEAIYAAKENGRNQVVLWPSLKAARFIGDRLAG